MQSEAKGRWERNRDPARSPPWSIRQRDPDDQAPRCKARRARCPHKPDIPAVSVSPTAASSRELHSLLNDGRPYYHCRFACRTWWLITSPCRVICRVWSLLRGILHLCQGRFCREMVCFALARNRWGIPSRQSCPNFLVTPIRIWRMNFVGSSLCRQQCRLCLQPLRWE